MNENKPAAYLPWIDDLVRNHKNWSCHGNASNPGTAPGEAGTAGKSLEFNWQGTKLGIRVEGDSSYVYTDLKGSNGESPHIDAATKHWFVGTIDTGINAEGLRGADGGVPNIKIGSVTTLPEGAQATATITGTAKEPVLNLGIPKGMTGNPATNTDEKVKLTSASTQAKYLSDYVDAQTIVINPDKNQLVVQSIQGLQTSVTTLNFIKNLDKDIMIYLNAISNPMTFREVLPNDAALATITGAMLGDTYIVQESESNDNKTMTYIYNGTDFVPIAETSIEVRDFSTDPLNIATETTGVLPEARIDSLLARKSEVLDKTTFAGATVDSVKKADTLVGLTHTPEEINQLFETGHEHINKSLLDSLVSNGDGHGFLNNKGNYVNIFWISSSAPNNTGILWIDDSDTTKPIMKFHNGTSWIPISSSSNGTTISVDSVVSDTSENPIQNKAIKKYVDEKETTISEDDGNAIKNHSDGIYVEDKSDEIKELTTTMDTIQRHRKYVNTTLEYCALGFRHDAALIENAQRLITCKINNPLPFDECQENHDMDYDLTSHTITLKAGKIYRLYGYTKTHITEEDSHIIRFYNKTDGVYLNNSTRISINDNGNSLEEIVSPEKDIQVSLNIAWVVSGDSATMRVGCFNLNPNGLGLNPKYKMINEVTFSAIEIGRAISIDPLDYVNTESGIEDTPVGTIIPVMATIAPPHYLACTGQIVNIADYPALAEHFKTNFGTYNYFGGNGTSTFAVPDLRGEFLRGSGSASRNTGEGATVGAHQDPTRVPHFHTHKSGSDRWIGAYVPDGGVIPYNVECPTKNSAYIVYTNGNTNGSAAFVKQTTSYSSRPTNTSVLYCIKAEPTHFMKVEGKDCYSYEKHLVGYWVDGKPLYEKTVIIQGGPSGTNIRLAHNITNYETIFVAQGSVILKHHPTGINDNGVVIPFCTASQTDSVGSWVDGDDIVVSAGTNRTGWTYYINIRWTEK